MSHPISRPQRPQPKRRLHRLYQQSQGELLEWSTGANILHVMDDEVVAPAKPPMAVQCELCVGEEPYPVVALLDTGATWSLMSATLAAEIGLDPDAGDPIPSPINHGGTKLHGRVQTVGLVLVVGKPAALDKQDQPPSDDWGQPLRVEARFVISPDWERLPRVVLGVYGFLDRVRVGVDADSAQGKARWSFGRAV